MRFKHVFCVNKKIFLTRGHQQRIYSIHYSARLDHQAEGVRHGRPGRSARSRGDERRRAKEVEQHSVPDGRRYRAHAANADGRRRLGWYAEPQAPSAERDDVEGGGRQAEEQPGRPAGGLFQRISRSCCLTLRRSTVASNIPYFLNYPLTRN